MILVRDGKREPGHMDMQKLDEFCAMLPEVKLCFSKIFHSIEIRRQQDVMVFK